MSEIGARECWDLLTRKLESSATVRDGWGRIPSNASGNVRPFEAMVSRHLHQAGFRPSYPGEAPFAVCLSHDVDILIISSREKFGTMRRGRLPLDPFGLFRREVDPRYSARHILDAEQRIEAVSSFYFMALEKEDEDFNYTLEEASKEIEMIRSAGCEIGLQGGHRAFAEEKILEDEKQRLIKVTGAVPKGYRNHYLRLDLPHTWKALERSGFVYDTTYGFSDTVGFRNGMCYPFRPIDPSTGSRMGLVEIPLIFMDATVLFNMRLKEDQAWDLFLQVLTEVRACGGVMTLLWHNNYMDVERRKFYERMLDRLASEKPWFCTGSQLVEHWTTSGQQEAMEALIDDELRPR